ncbi:MAG TPA: TadE/TadG family type IV pilus assembly protein, partial [Candidatus Limnocylindrales bacterium]
MSNPKRSPSGRRSNRRRGQAMVEFALVIPIFLLVLSGMLDFGFALFSRMTVINAARDGARAAIMVEPGGYGTIPLVAQQTAVASAKQGGLTVTVSTSADVTCLLTHASPTSLTRCGNWNKYDLTTNPTGPQSGDSISVTVHYTFTP